MQNQRHIVAIEIGSSKIKGAVGTVSPDGILTVAHVEEERQNPGYVRYGAVQNVVEVANVLNRIILKLNNRISPRKISAVYVGVGGRSLCAAIRPIDLNLPEGTEITPEIIAEILGRAEHLPDSSREVLQVIPGEFLVDNRAVPYPIGTIGSSISASTAVISCRSQNVKNLSLAIANKLQLRINGYVVTQTAIADLVLTDEERQLGVMLVDFGAETSTISIYKGGYLRYLSTIPLGSRCITRDIMTRNYSEERAEELKKAIGNALPDVADSHRMRVDGVDDTDINNLVSYRAGEIVANVLERINVAGLTPPDLPAGIVVVGGATQLTGFVELLSEQSELSVRRGTTPASVRKGANRIHLADDIDVVAILAKLAAEKTAPCVTEPKPKEPEPEPAKAADENGWDDEPTDDDPEIDHAPTGRGWWKRVVSSVRQVIEPDSNDEEEPFD